MYKQSNYNYFVPYKEEKFIYYNALTRNSFTMSKAEHERIQIEFADPISFELGFPTVFRHFKECGFFVKEGIDEIANLRFKYNKEVVYCSDVHITLCQNKEVQSMELLVVAIQKHLFDIINTIHPPTLHLDSTEEKTLSFYEEVFTPVAAYVEKQCKQNGISFRQQEAKEVGDDKCCSLNLPRLYRYVILNNGDVYSREPGKKDSELWGKLANDGTIEWDEQQREQALSVPWFETEKCRRCKHLYLFSPICLRVINSKRGRCFQDLGVVTPEEMIVKEFEEKNA